MKRAALFLAVWLSGIGFAARGEDVVFAAYNLQNYSPIIELGRKRPGKTAESATAVARIIKEIAPGILGICEMGSPMQFEEFRKRLAESGLDYPSFEYVEAADPDRHLALVSRYPIVSRQSVTDAPFDANGTRAKIRRGILDVTVQVNPRYQLRILGVHLKSKMPAREDEELLRRNEAHLLRLRVDEILAADPATHLLVFGDFNDTKDQPTLREIAGRQGAPNALTALALEDSAGDRWTHHWEANDTYARIDFLFVNRALSSRISRARCSIYRSAGWNKASDHRPLIAVVNAPQ